ncbi:MAG: hypothetical protein FJ267_15260, partial [Planctomycetes bacterium]|nr:hypothetical protein [Planctomycetota bacterium]
MQSHFRWASTYYDDALKFENQDKDLHEIEKAEAVKGKLTCLLHLRRFGDIDWVLRNVEASQKAKVLIDIAEPHVAGNRGRDPREEQLSDESCVWCLSKAIEFGDAFVSRRLLLKHHLHLGRREPAMNFASKLWETPELRAKLDLHDRALIRDLLGDDVAVEETASRPELEAETDGFSGAVDFLTEKLQMAMRSGVFDERTARAIGDVQPLKLFEILVATVKNAQEYCASGLHARSFRACGAASQLLVFAEERYGRADDWRTCRQAGRFNEKEFFDLILENVGHSGVWFGESQFLECVAWSLNDLPSLVENGPYANQLWERVPPVIRVRCLRESHKARPSYKALELLSSELLELGRQRQLEDVFREMLASFKSEMDDL